MAFMVVNTNSYDLLLRLDFLIKIGEIVDVEKKTIQINQGLGNNIQVMPLNMVNMLQVVRKHVWLDVEAMENLEKEFI
jgi:hypothetical protein